jgi:hypothetical protein
LSSTAQLGYAKIALALLLRVIFFQNHSRRVYQNRHKIHKQPDYMTASGMVDGAANNTDSEDWERLHYERIASVVELSAERYVHKEQDKDDVAPGVPRFNGECSSGDTGDSLCVDRAKVVGTHTMMRVSNQIAERN